MSFATTLHLSAMFLPRDGLQLQCKSSSRPKRSSSTAARGKLLCWDKSEVENPHTLSVATGIGVTYLIDDSENASITATLDVMVLYSTSSKV